MSIYCSENSVCDKTVIFNNHHIRVKKWFTFLVREGATSVTILSIVDVVFLMFTFRLKH